MVDNADMQRVARMVAETQRLRVRLLWDDQRMRQSVAAAAGFDRLGKSVAAAHTVQLRPLFDTKRLVGPMFGGELQRIAQGLAGAHRASMRPALDASKMIKLGMGGELQRAGQAMAEAHRVSMRPAFDASKMIRIGLGGKKMRQMMAAAAGLDKIPKIMADGYRVRTPPLFDTKKLIGPMFGGEFQRIAQGMADAYQVPVRPRFDVQGVVEVAQGIVEATIVVPSNATTGSLAVVDGSVPAEAPLFPGLMNPWQQVRCWDLQAWIAFLTFLVAVAGLLVAMEQSRPQVGLRPEALEKIIRIIQENEEPSTGKFAPSTTNAPTRPKSARWSDGEKGRVPTMRPSPTSG
jgi:hypothetical protein